MFNEPPQLPAESAEQTTAPPYLPPSQPAPLPAFCAHAQDYIWSARDQWNLLNSTTMWYKEIRHVQMLKETDLVAGKALPVKTFLDSVKLSEIIILPNYPDVVRRIANIYSSPTFAEQGVLVTGQPGIGKSVLLSYLLLVLLNLTSEEHPQPRLRAPPVFLYTNTDEILFFGGHIYSPKAHVHFTPQMLPEPKSFELTEGPDDLDHDTKEPEGLVDVGHIFIVQSSSPNPSRYHYWVNWKNAIVICLPLWSREPTYSGHARRRLDASLNHWVKKQRVARGLSTAEDEGIADTDLLDVGDLSLSGLSGFQKEMFLELPQQHRTTLEVAEVSDAELQSPDVLELIMEKLLNSAIEHFGYAARDIYTYLQNPAIVLSVHDDTYLPWKHAVTFLNTYLATGRALMMEGETTQGTGRLSHRICALKLNELANKANFWVSDSFTVVWKSPYIRSEIERKQRKLTDEDRGKLFALLSVYSKATTFAANIYEPVQRGYEYEKLPDQAQLELDCYCHPIEPNNSFFDSFILRNGGRYIVAAFIQISIARGRGHTHTTTIANARHALSVRARSQIAVIYQDVKTLHEENCGTKEPAKKARRTTETDAPSSHKRHRRTLGVEAGGRFATRENNTYMLSLLQD
ncbi:hypothetical protein F5051DRAFT_504125 [Lentinula edodes]|nr:hypothetical protein F5051DRAFT_504125 [Lentinula edodes]